MPCVGKAACIGATAAAFGLACVLYRRLRAAELRCSAEAAARAAEARRKNELALELMTTRNKLMHSAQSVEKGRKFVPAPSDVFIVTYPKCGTTWMMQIVHALRTGAQTESMAFGEITEVVPWDVLAHDCGQDLSAPQVAIPRAFKSHATWPNICKGGRYLYVARDPVDAFYSFYKFLPSYTNLQPGDLTQDQFADAIFANASHSGQIWDHFLGWWEQRHNPDVMWVFYEDLKDDLPGSIARIAEFLGVPCSPALLERTVSLSSFEFMSSPEQAHHFDDHFVRRHVLPNMGLPPDLPAAVSKVRKGGGTVGSRDQIPPHLRQRLERRWAETLEPATGCASYAALRASYEAHRPMTPHTAYAAERPRVTSGWFSR